MVGDLVQEVANAIETRFLLVHRLDNPPRGFRNVRALQHDLFRRRVILPAPSRLQIHGAQFPLLERIVDTHHEPEMLLVITNRKPILDENDAGAHEHPFELRHGAQKLLALLVRAKVHDPFDAGAIVPAAVEQNDLARGRQVRSIALEIPLRPLALVGRGEGSYSANARVKPLRDALDHPALARRVAAFEDDDNLQALRDDPILQLDQLALQSEKLAKIKGPIDARLLGARKEFLGHLIEARIIDLHFEFFIEAVDEFVTYAAIEILGAHSAGHRGVS